MLGRLFILLSIYRNSRVFAFLWEWRHLLANNLSYSHAQSGQSSFLFSLSLFPFSHSQIYHKVLQSITKNLPQSAQNDSFESTIYLYLYYLHLPIYLIRQSSAYNYYIIIQLHTYIHTYSVPWMMQTLYDYILLHIKQGKKKQTKNTTTNKLTSQFMTIPIISFCSVWHLDVTIL